MNIITFRSLAMPSEKDIIMMPGNQVGAALITSLVFLSILTVLGMTTLGTAVLESRMSGNSRDRTLAFQAAEMGLRDAELYIRDSGRIVNQTEIGYGQNGTCDESAGTCDAQTCLHGVCYNGGDMANQSGSNWYANAVWQDGANSRWANALQYAHADSVAGTAGIRKIVGNIETARLTVFNAATGQCTAIIGTCAYSQPTALPLVARQPEYLIEIFGKGVDATHCAIGTINPCYYRITARGYGTRVSTRVTLQEIYTPSAPPAP